MRVTKIITWWLVCAFLISGCAKNENADSAAEPEESVQEDYQEETEQEQSEEWDLSQEDEWMPEDQPLEEMASGTGVDYDLTQMNGDMVYATVYQMMADPSTYEGKTFRMHLPVVPREWNLCQETDPIQISQNIHQKIRISLWKVSLKLIGKRTMKTCIAALPMRPWKWCSKE